MGERINDALPARAGVIVAHGSFYHIRGRAPVIRHARQKFPIVCYGKSAPKLAPSLNGSGFRRGEADGGRTHMKLGLSVLVRP